MTLLKVFDIAGSGMTAQSVRLNTTASNMANLNTVAGDPESAYRARQPVFETVLQRGAADQPAGVRVVEVVESGAEPARVYEPGHPQADAEGYVYRSNVNLAAEMTNMISASRSFQNNAEILSTSRDLLLRTLNLGN
jgi:flagellar basal-body rod protein FlgC